ncbi:MAG: hypothetical protein K8T91_18705 [Planctomycetes bacterium]|nr:hypothetical protein [Planctomycetota bacterium]
MDLEPLIFRALEALDAGRTITFDELRRRIRAGELWEVLQEAGKYPIPAIPDVDFQEITDTISDILEVNRGDEAEHFYISNNGYCLLIAVLREASRDAADVARQIHG